MAQQGAATDLYASPNTGLVHQLRQNPYVLGLASVSAPHRTHVHADAAWLTLRSDKVRVPGGLPLRL